jgi:hypothetical protein
VKLKYKVVIGFCDSPAVAEKRVGLFGRTLFSPSFSHDGAEIWCRREQHLHQK